MPALSDYIETRINTWRKFKELTPMDVTNLTDEDAQELFNSLECDLSPENLHCDGEISRAQANAKYKKFMAAGNQLLKMGFTPADKWSSFL